MPRGPAIGLTVAGNERGSVAVVTAVSLLVLVGVLAFTLNTGYLYTEKNRFQVAVEAAAMAGAVALCQPDPEEIARQVLVGNLTADSTGAAELPDEYRTDVAVGYYDADRVYDFSTISSYGFKSFVEAASMPEGLLENAVLVRLIVTEKVLIQGFSSDDSVRVAAAAVAYASDYDMLSLSEEDPIVIDTDFAGFPEYRDMKVHSNQDITCAQQQPQFTDVRLTASEALNNCTGREGRPVVELRPIDWDEYRAGATVLTHDHFAGGTLNEPLAIGENRGYLGGGSQSSMTFNNPILELREGNHGGVVYYYSAENDPDDERTLFLNQFSDRDLYSMTGFTVVSEIPVAFTQVSTGSTGGGRFGGADENLVRVVSAGAISAIFALKEFSFEGVYFRTEKEFYNFEKIVSFWDPADIETRWKIVAKKGIRLYPPMKSKIMAQPVSLVYTGGFMRPCDHHELRWGRLD